MFKYKEFVAAFTGPRGGTKTANAVLWSIDAMSNDVPCHSNQPIKTRMILPDNSVKLIQSIDLDYPKFLTTPDYYYRVLVFLDELQLFANSLRTMSNGNLLLQEISSQIRKQEMSVFYTIQDFAWADSRFSFQTDVVVECSDLAFTPWGMEEGLEQGELAQCIYKDMTGIYTGRPYSKYFESHTFTVPLKESVWGTYNTKNMVDPNQGRKQYTFEKEQVVIKQGPEGTYIETKQNPDDAKMRFQSLLNQMSAGGYDEIGFNDLWTQCKDMGIEADNKQLGMIAKQFGLERKDSRRKGLYYVFPTHPEHSANRQAEREMAGVEY